MKKKKTLALSRQTIRQLSAAQTAKIVGGYESQQCTGVSCWWNMCGPPPDPGLPPIPPPPPSFGPPAQCWP